MGRLGSRETSGEAATLVQAGDDGWTSLSWEPMHGEEAGRFWIPFEGGAVDVAKVLTPGRDGLPVSRGSSVPVGQSQETA